MGSSSSLADHALFEVDSAITLFGADLTVAYQNAASLDYYGPLLGGQLPLADLISVDDGTTRQAFMAVCMAPCTHTVLMQVPLTLNSNSNPNSNSNSNSNSSTHHRLKQGQEQEQEEQEEQEIAGRMLRRHRVVSELTAVSLPRRVSQILRKFNASRVSDLRRRSSMSAGRDDGDTRWHQVTLKWLSHNPNPNPSTRLRMLTQHDVTDTVRFERALAEVTEMHLDLLSRMLPHDVIASMTKAKHRRQTVSAGLDLQRVPPLLGTKIAPYGLNAHHHNHNHNHRRSNKKKRNPSNLGPAPNHLHHHTTTKHAAASQSAPSSRELRQSRSSPMMVFNAPPVPPSSSWSELDSQDFTTESQDSRDDSSRDDSQELLVVQQSDVSSGNSRSSHERLIVTASSSSKSSGGGPLAYSHREVTILFMDVVDFTHMADSVPAGKVMTFLNALFSGMDSLLDVHGVQKVETAGDCYIVAAGITSTEEYDTTGFAHIMDDHDAEDSARRVFAFARSMLAHATTVPMPDTGIGTRVRVGMHTGPCVSGMVGSRLPKFGIFGDTMNMASRMESTAPAGSVQVSAATYGYLPPHDRAMFRSTGGINVKGKGVQDTYVFTPISTTTCENDCAAEHRAARHVAFVGVP